MYSVKIYFCNIAEPIVLNFDRKQDQTLLMKSATAAMSNKELLTLEGSSGIMGIINSAEIRAIIAV